MSNQPALDTELFPFLKEVVGSVYDTEIIQSMLVYDQSEYNRFITNEVENPHFRFRKDSFDEGRAQKQLAVCEDQINASSAPEVVIQLYRAKLKTQVQRCDMLVAASNRNDEAFSRISQDLYGRPRSDYFSMIVHFVLNQQPKTKAARHALATLEQELSHVSKPEQKLPIDVLPPIESGDDTAVTAEQAKEIFEAELSSHGVDSWRVLVDATNSRPVFSVDTRAHIVHVPSNEAINGRSKVLTVQGVKALAAHEIGVHVVRSINGQQSQLLLLSLGLDRYLRGEEGLASYSQQQIEGSTLFSGQDKYFATSLAVGLDGTERDFRSVFSMMIAYYQVLLDATEATDPVIIKRAWYTCQRIFRGTSGSSAGCVFTRDLAYFEGNIGIWEYITQHPERYEHLFIGKFDPLNDRHVTSLQTLGILPEW